MSILALDLSANRSKATAFDLFALPLDEMLCYQEASHNNSLVSDQVSRRNPSKCAKLSLDAA